MAEYTLSELFGSTATQDIDSITISKSELVQFGLTPAVSNVPEQLAVGVIMLLAQNATETTRLQDTASRQLAIEYLVPDIWADGGTTYERKLWSVVVYTPYTDVPLDISTL